jgi:hypothetical protein
LHSRPICFGQFSRGGVEGSQKRPYSAAWRSLAEGPFNDLMPEAQEGCDNGQSHRRFYTDGSITGAGSVESSNQTAKKLATNYLDMIVKEIGGNDFVVFVDDFHYIEPEVREEIGR